MYLAYGSTIQPTENAGRPMMPRRNGVKWSARHGLSPDRHPLQTLGQMKSKAAGLFLPRHRLHILSEQIDQTQTPLEELPA